MAPQSQGVFATDPQVDNEYEEEIEEVFFSEDDESYEEILVESDDETEEEIIEEEVIEESDEEGDGTESGEYLDDDSSAPPPSVDEDNPIYGEDLGRSFRADAGVDLLTKKRSEMQLEMSNAAVSEGSRKAMEEQLARERSMQRQAAKEALQRRRLEQEAAKRQTEEAVQNRSQQEPPTNEQQALQRQKQQDDTARRRLIEEIRKVDLALSRKRDKVAKTRIHGTAEVEKRKKALAELRRQAAREELARDNDKLKAAKAFRRGSNSLENASVKSAATFRHTSLLQGTKPPPSPAGSAPGQLNLSRVVDAIKSVNVLSNPDPISPLRGASFHDNAARRPPLRPPPLTHNHETNDPLLDDSESETTDQLAFEETKSLTKVYEDEGSGDDQ